jgi:hypothetical protein
VDDSTYGLHIVILQLKQITGTEIPIYVEKLKKKEGEREREIRVNGICSKSHQTLKLL